MTHRKPKEALIPALNLLSDRPGYSCERTPWVLVTGAEPLNPSPVLKPAPPNLHESLTHNVRLRLKQSQDEYRPGCDASQAKNDNISTPVAQPIYHPQMTPIGYLQSAVGCRPMSGSSHPSHSLSAFGGQGEVAGSSRTPHSALRI